MRNRKEIRNRVIMSAAVATVVGFGHLAHAQYLTTDTFTPNSSSWSDLGNWSAGLPTGTALANVTGTSGTETVDSNLTAYALDLTSGATAISGPSTLTLLSKDTVFDATAKTSPAIYGNNTGAVALNMPIQLGDGTTTSGTAFFDYVGTGGFQFGNIISQAPGQSWGVTIGGTISMRGSGSGPIPITERGTYTGALDVLPGAFLLIQNDMQSYGAGDANTEIDGTIARSLNGSAMILNAVDGTGTITLAAGNGKCQVVFGANGGNGNFSGVINGNVHSTPIRVYKVGAGTQAIGTGANAQQTTWVEEGAVSVTAMSQLGLTSAITTLDGGALTYLGAGETTATTNLNLSFRGGSLIASGTGALTIGTGSTFANSDVAIAFGDAGLTAPTSEVMTNCYGLTGLSQFVGKISGLWEQTPTSGQTSTALTIDEVNRTIDLGTGHTINQASSGQGSPQIALTAIQAINRTLTLAGTNTGLNTIGIPLTDEPSGSAAGSFGATLAVTKTDAGTWVLGATNTYSGGTNVNAGTLVAGTATALPAGKAITIGGTGTLKLASGIGGQTFASTSLTINSGGSLDLTNNHAFITYGGTDPATTILAQVTSGAAGGAWTGTGITSSTAATTSGYGVAYGDGADGIASNLTSGQIEVAYALLGDIKMTGAVNALDFGILAGNFGKAVTGGWEQGDLNYDGVVNAIDFGDLAGNFGKSATGTAVAVSAADWAALDSFAAANGLLADVPEPASIGLMVVAGAGILSRRRRKH